MPKGSTWVTVDVGVAIKVSVPVEVDVGMEAEVVWEAGEGVRACAGGRRVVCVFGNDSAGGVSRVMVGLQALRKRAAKSKRAGIRRIGWAIKVK
jgi:hypothetical protein